jgi:hypothetical protein
MGKRCAICQKRIDGKIYSKVGKHAINKHKIYFQNENIKLKDVICNKCRCKSIFNKSRNKNDIPITAS